MGFLVIGIFGEVNVYNPFRFWVLKGNENE